MLQVYVSGMFCVFFYILYPLFYIDKMFLNDVSLCSPRMQLFDQKYSKNSNIVKYCL